MVKVTNRITRESVNITFFPDDTVETVLQRIGEAADIHPDRLFVTVTLKRPSSYYTDDPRRWEALFNRLSYGGKVVLKLPLQLYQTYYRYPQPQSINYSEFGMNEWKAMPVEDDLKSLFESDSEFTEQLIFGTDEATSYILPLAYDPALTTKIPAAAYPIPQKAKLISTLYPRVADIQEFTYTAFSEDAEASKAIYFPFLQTTTPERLPVTTLQILQESSDRLRKLLELNVPSEKKASVLRARFRIPFVETNFGPAVHNRFEQMFYGLTVSAQNPVISIFTSPEETSRHKFFVKPGRTKKPEHFDWWRGWWAATKPYKHKPTLVLYRGESLLHYDRIAITSTEMILMSFRPEGQESDPTNLKTDLAKWIQTLDSIMPFTNPNDFKDMRWETQDISILLKYSKKLNEYDLHRFNCMTSIFDMSEAEQSTFRLLRTDHSVEGLTSMDVRIIQLLKEKTNVTLTDIQTELGVSPDVAQSLKTNMERLIEENPNILNRSFRGFPTMRLGSDTILISSTTQFILSIQYANILRFILANADASALNKICPARKDVVPVQTSIAPAQNMEVNTELMGEYESLFEGMEEDEAPPKQAPAAMPQLVADAPPPPETKVKPKARSTLYNYFNNRLQKFDSNTFDPTDSEYPKKCEQKHQPIILNDEDLERIKDSEYDPRKIAWTEWSPTQTYKKDDDVVSEGTYYKSRKDNNIGSKPPSSNWRETNKVAGRVIDMGDPLGAIVCPEYWCMTDEIPLREEDLVDKACPVCKGKIRTSTKDDTREFSVIERDKKYTYPGWTAYKSPNNGHTLPCCYKEQYTGRENTVDHFYIFDADTHPIPPLRCATLPKSIFQTLKIDEAHRERANYYEDFVDMRFGIEGQLHGYFRVGLGNPLETIPRFLGQDTFKIPNPRDSVANIIKCSFVSSWPHPSDKNVADIMRSGGIHESLAKIISGIAEAFERNELTVLQSLEYACVCMGCDMYRILLSKDPANNKLDLLSLGCNFYSPRFKKSDKRAIVILQIGSDLDILSYVRRKKFVRARKGERNNIPAFEFIANINDPRPNIFTKDTSTILDKIRSDSCSSSVPSYTDAVKVMDVLGLSDYSIVADPYQRAQAFYIPYKLLLPFQPTPLPPDTTQQIIEGYTDIKAPTYEDVKAYLSKIPASIKGYESKEDAYNWDRQRTEIILGCGLRIPVVPSAVENTRPDPKEVIQTTQTVNETNLAFGAPDDSVKKEYADVSYASEVFDFLLFELSKDLKEEALDLRRALDTDTPETPTIDPLLRKWFDATIQEADVSSSEQFVSKVRKPCGQFKESECGGNVCAWNGKTCQVKVRNSVNKKNLYNRLLSSLVGNPKVRYTVLEGRNTPFFSTILYVELPHELIVTDGDLATIK